MIDFYPKMHGWLNIYKLINVIKDINRLKDKICIIISKDGVKAFGIIQNASMIKVLETIELEGMYLKRYIRKNYSQCYHKLRIAPKLLTKFKKKTWLTTTHSVFQYCAQSTSWSNKA